jgi:peroxiredoxin
LSDSEGSLLDAVGIRHVGAHEGRDIAYPTSVLVDRAGTVQWIYTSGKVTRRANPAEVLAAIGTLPD